MVSLGDQTLPQKSSRREDIWVGSLVGGSLEEARRARRRVLALGRESAREAKIFLPLEGGGLGRGGEVICVI